MSVHTKTMNRRWLWRSEQLHRAVETRDIIGQAKGMLMERFEINAAAAFQLLVRLSQKSNTAVEAVPALIAPRG
ncbi:MAG: ANTAR domain-containing protein [Mycobacterium sp.]